jgi:hypothetical protein
MHVQAMYDPAPLIYIYYSRRHRLEQILGINTLQILIIIGAHSQETHYHVMQQYSEAPIKSEQLVISYVHTNVNFF